MKKKIISLFKIGEDWKYPTFFIFITALFFGGLAPYISVFQNNPSLANAYVAIGTLILAAGTLILAFFTWSSVYFSNKRDKQERKYRLLNDVIEWASEVAESAINRQKKDKNQLWKTRSDYKICKAKGIYIKEVTTAAFEDLIIYIERIDEKLQASIVEIEKELDKKTVSTDNIKKSELELEESVENLFRLAASIKVKDSGFKLKEGKQMVDVNTPKEPSLSEIKDLIKRSKINPFAQGIFIAGITQLFIFLAMFFSAGFSLSFKEDLNNILNVNGQYTLVAGLFLTIVGGLWMKFGKK